MLRTRIIPALLVDRGSLVKTRKFKGRNYVGDPCNTLRIFNELEVDELVVLDISATPDKREPDWALLKDIASECFMPLAYGGGLRTFDQARRVFGIGFEKVVINSELHARPEFISELAAVYGSQAIVASIDVRRDLFGRERVVSRSAQRSHKVDLADWARTVEAHGAGEILLTNVDREGTWTGFDIEMVKRVTDAVDIPVIAQGGAAGVRDLVSVVREGGASSAAVVAMVVYQKKDFCVLVNFPEPSLLKEAFSSQDGHPDDGSGSSEAGNAEVAVR